MGSARALAAEPAEYTVLAVHNVERISEAIDVGNRLGIPCRAVLSSAALELGRVCGVKPGVNTSEAEPHGRLNEEKGDLIFEVSVPEELERETPPRQISYKDLKAFLQQYRVDFGRNFLGVNDCRHVANNVWSFRGTTLTTFSFLPGRIGLRHAKT